MLKLHSADKIDNWYEGYHFTHCHSAGQWSRTKSFVGQVSLFNFYIKPCLNVRPLRNKDFICYSINLRFHNTIKVIMLYALLWFESFLCMPRFGVKEFSNFNVNSREQWLHCGGKKIEAIMNTQYQPDREPWFRVLIITWKKSKKTYLLNFPVQDNKKMKK